MVLKKRGLNQVNLGLSAGILTGAFVLLATLANVLFGQYVPITNMFLDFYGIFGYDITIFGALLGGVYGFIDGFIFLWLFGLIYNRLK